jgi:hypothetical protein
MSVVVAEPHPIDKIYTGCERGMMLIAKHIDGEPVSPGDSWHASLLLRMKNSYPDIRPAVLSQPTFVTGTIRHLDSFHGPKV